MFQFSRIKQEMISILVFFIVLVIILIINMKYGLLTTSDSMNILLITALVIATFYYAGETAKISKNSRVQTEVMLEQTQASRKMAEEMMQQRYGHVLPILDIQEQDKSAKDMIRTGLIIGSGQIPEGLSCLLRNVGLGPALNVWTFIIVPIDRRRHQWDFGVLSVDDKTGVEWLSIEQHDSRSVLVAYYKDVYGRPFESSREFISYVGEGNYELGPLRIRELTEEEYVMSVSKRDSLLE